MQVMRGGFGDKNREGDAEDRSREKRRVETEELRRLDLPECIALCTAVKLRQQRSTHHSMSWPRWMLGTQPEVPIVRERLA